MQHRTMSNFSAQYKNFKQQKQGGKSLERRNINISGQKGMAQDAMYFKGDDTDENLPANNTMTAPGMHDLAQRTQVNPPTQTINSDIRAVQTPAMMTGSEFMTAEQLESARILSNQSVDYYRSGGPNSIVYN